MQVILKYHGELVEFFSADNNDNITRVDVNEEDSVYSVIDRFNIPREIINLVLVNGIKVNLDDCESYHFSDGDTLAVWPVSA